MDQAGAGGLETGLEGLDGFESAELGQSNGLLNILAGDLAGGGLLEGVDNILAGGGNLIGLAGEGDSEETGVRVGVVLGRDVELREALGGLGEEREAGGPLDGGLAAEQSSEDGGLGLEASSAKGAGAGEGNYGGAAVLGGDTLLTTEVLASLGGLDLVLAGGGTSGQILEELADPLGNIGGVGAGGDETNVGFGVGILGELSEGITRQVLLVRGGLGGGDGSTQATVEGNTVGGIKGNVLGAGGESQLLVLEEIDDNLLQFVV